MTRMEFDTLPEPGAGLWLSALARKKGLGEGENLPRFEAVVPELTVQGLEAYQRICGFPLTGSLPITFPQVVAAPLHIAIFTHRDFPLPAMGLVHVSSRIEQRRPIGASEPMAVRCWIEGQRPARRGVEADLVTEIEVGGEPVWESITTVLSRAGQGHGQKSEAPPIPQPEPTRSVTWSLPTDLGRRYSRVAGDRNPIHLYAWTAKIFGFKRHIIHGMWLLARAMAELDTDLGPEAVAVDVQFKRPVFLPGKALFSAGPHEGGTAFRLDQPLKGKTHLFGSVSRLT